MSYSALYRKFRPQTFDEVKGQDHIVTTLKNQIRNHRLGHAYLFCGTRGTGKTTVAKILAKAVNCEHPIDGEPCGECETCKSITEGSSLNVIEIDAASNNGVDNIYRETLGTAVNMAVDILKANDLPLDILVVHVLNPEFVRLYIPDRHQIGSITISKQELYEGQLIQRFSNLSEKQKDAVNMVYDLYDKDINVKKENIRLFMESWDERVNLVVLKDWWNGLDAGVQITSVGRVLAHSNAQRCDKNLPPFE